MRPARSKQAGRLLYVKSMNNTEFSKWLLGEPFQKNKVESRKGLRQLSYMKELNMGNAHYELVRI